MKTKLTALVVIMLALVVVVGCTLLTYEEYEVGAAIHEINGLTVSIDAMLWIYEDSGTIPHRDWSVSWGDGLWVYGTPAVYLEPFYRWTHTYTQTGSYVIAVRCGGSDPAILFANIE